MVMLNTNKDMRQGDVVEMMASLNLRDVILSHHPNEEAPATHKTGSSPINTIFVSSPEIPTIRATWLAGDQSPGNHRAGYVNVPWTARLGEEVVQVIQPTTQCWTCKVPKVQRRYNQYLEKNFHQHQLLPKLTTITKRSVPGTPLSPNDQRAMTKLDKVRKEGMVAAEKMVSKAVYGGGGLLSASH